VPRLFRAIQRAIDRRAHDLTVTYGRHGVPKKVTIDTYENVGAMAGAVRAAASAPAQAG